MRKRIISLVLVCLVLLNLVACGANTQEQATVANENQVIDGAGQVLDIPKNREQTTIASVYAVSVPFIEALGLGDRVLAINVKSNFWKDADPALKEAGSVGRGSVDLEALATFQPGVLIHRSNDMETVEAVQKINIPVLCITVEDMDDITQTLTMMGNYFGKEERAAEVIQWMDTKFAMIDSIVAEIPADERKTVLVLGGELGRIAADDMLQAWMAEKAGGVFVAKDTAENRNWVNVGVEQVFTWNPEFIFATSSTPLDYSIEDMQSDSSWSAVTAVKNSNVYQIPSKLDSWDIPGVSCVIGTMYMLHKMYPEHFSAEQLEQEVAEYYTFMFGETFDAAYLGYDLNS